MEKAKTYKELLEEFKDNMESNQLADNECMLLVASTDETLECCVKGTGKELVATLAKILADDEQLKDMLYKALKIAEVVTTLKKVAEDGNVDKLASLLGGKEDKQ